jgi:glycerate kinase
MRIVVAPDSYKGSLSAIEVGNIIRSALLAEIPDAQVDVVPMADGGEGTVDALLAGTGGERIRLTATGPMGTAIPTFYGILAGAPGTDAKTAVIETAAVAGLTLVPPEKRNPVHLTTYGLGECIRHALDQGIRRLIIGLGGSATNDGGLGMLQALGATFVDADGKQVPAPACSVIDALTRIVRADYSTLDPRLKETDILIASDVKSPLCGPQGASFVFGPQKGATPEQVQRLDRALASFAEKVERHLGRSYQHLPGAGAAGGLGFALMSIGGKVHAGAELVAQAAGLPEKLCQADWLITGEGKTDHQTLLGKLPIALARLARAHSVRTILISGSLDSDAETLNALNRHFDALFAIPNRPMTLEEAIRESRTLLAHTARNIARLIR